jgi:hypothetical protein
MKYRWTPVSNNVKTGPIPVSVTHASSCPPECPLAGQGCYAQHGPLSLVWRHTPLDIDDLADRIRSLPEGSIWRHNQAGDLPGEGSRIDWHELSRIVLANQNRSGFTYTHKPVHDGPHAQHNRDCIQASNRLGFTINLSADNLQEADELASLEIGPVVAIVPHDRTVNTTTPAGRKVVICPATQRDDITCQTCQLCAKQSRSVVVGFPAHGIHRRIVSEMAALPF